MLLLTFSEWWGANTHIGLTPGQQARIPESTRPTAFATRLPLPQALAAIAAYQRAWNQTACMAINLSLLAVTPIDETDPETLAALRVGMVEFLDERECPGADVSS